MRVSCLPRGVPGLLLAVALLAAAAPARADFATDAYFTAKAEARRSIDRLRKSKGNEAGDAKETAALRDLAGKLATAIGPVAVDGFKREGTSNVTALSAGDLGEGSVDGLSFAATTGDDQLVVTTDGLVTRWLRANRASWDPAETAPRDLAGALASDAFYTQVIGADAAVGTFGRLPVTAPAGITAEARLIDRRQDYVLGAPTELLVIVHKGERILMARVKAEPQPAMIPACATIWTSFEAKAAAAKKPVEDEDKARMAVDRSFRQCFGERLKEQPAYAGLLRQAQDLVDRMAK
jgi:hypothetical protein